MSDGPPFTVHTESRFIAALRGHPVLVRKPGAKRKGRTKRKVRLRKG